MIVVEPVPIHRTGVLTRGNFRHDDDAVIPAFRRVTDACREANPDVVLIHQLYHVGQHGDADNSFAPNWSPSGLPSYHDADGSHAMTTDEIEELIEGFVARRRPRPGVGLRRRRDLRGVPRGRRPVLGALVEPAHRRVGRHLREPDALLVRDPEPDPRALRRRLHRRSGGQRGSRLGGHAARSRSSQGSSPGTTSARLMDYVTCGTGSLLRLPPDHPAVALPAAARRAVRGGAQGGRPARPRPGREPHPDAGGAPRRSSPPATPTWSASSAARSPIRTWSPRPATAAPTRSGRASRATSCAGAVARATTGSRAWSTRRPGASSSGAATGSSRPQTRVACWWSVAGRPGSRRRGSPPNAATR